VTSPAEVPARRILAGIDIGTLTCRLLIAECLDDGRLRELASDRRILRLGEGVDCDRLLQPLAMDRVLSVLREWRHRIEQSGVSQCSIVATSAVRDAANRDEFLARVKRDTGLEVEVITGEEEARRTLLGIRSGLSAESNSLLAVDIGGGSTEFILDRPPAVSVARSVEVGVVRMTERFFHNDPPTDRQVAEARAAASGETQAALRGMGGLDDVTFVGTAGTITSLAAMEQGLSTYDSARIHNYRLPLEGVLRLEHALRARTKAERQGMPGLERGREDVIVAGVVILHAVMAHLRRNEILVSDYGLREGVVIDLCQRTR
jgi:exopolyphosphatase / guanosine-5'-triphosphate,3'-diphosphate pyrophosphatase